MSVADHRPGPGTPDSGVKVSGYVLSDGPGTLRPFSTHLTWSLQSEPLRPGDGTRFNDIEFSEDLIEPEFHPLIERAFAAWAQVSGLSVTRLPDGSDANIVIAYTADPNPSQQGTVAAVSGRVWWCPTRPSSGQKGFFNTVLHEIGHALGTDHSDVEDVVMSGPPHTHYWHTGGWEELQPEDIAAVSVRTV